MKTFRLAILVLAVSCACAFADERPVILKIGVKNPSGARRDVPVEYHLPVEIQKNDVLERGELALDYDTSAGKYRLTTMVTLGSHDSRIYEVHVRDVWAGNSDWAEKLINEVDRLMAEADSGKLSADAPEALGECRTELESIRAETAPAVKNAAYVAFGRRQADQLGDIKRRLDSLRPPEARVSMLTGRMTWIAVAAILLFLAAVAAYVLFRS